MQQEYHPHSRPYQPYHPHSYPSGHPSGHPSGQLALINHPPSAIRPSGGVKIVHQGKQTVEVAGYGVIFHSEDLQGEQFLPTTDFKLGLVPRPLVYWDHSLGTPEHEIGIVTKIAPDQHGLWMEMELDKANLYEEMLDLIAQGKVGISTGSISHLVRREGKTLRVWPIVEASLTVTPAEAKTRDLLQLRQGTMQDITQNEESTVVDHLANPLTTPIEETYAMNAAATKYERTTAAGTAVGTVAGTVAENDLQERLASLEAAVKAFQHAPPEPTGGYVWQQSAPDAEGYKREAAVKGFQAYIRRGVKAALQEDTAGEGGYLVPQIYSDALISAMREASVLRAAGARIMPVVGTNSFNVPVMANTGAAVLTSEEAAFDEQEPTFDQITLTPYKYTRLARVSDELLADNRVDVVQNVLLPDFAQAFAAAENIAFATGTGVGQPQGIVNGASTVMSTGAFSADNIIKIYHALPYAYRQKAVWLANDAVIQIIRSLKETTNQYLWQPGLQAGQPDMLLGRPVYTLNTMTDSTASGSKCLVFGDLSYFWIVDFGAQAVRRLDELYAANGQVGFRAYRRVDSRVMLDEAVKILTIA